MEPLKPWEREIIQEYIDEEKAVYVRLEEAYRLALKSIDEKIAAMLGQAGAELPHVIYRADYQKSVKDQITAILAQLQADEFETVSTFISNSYDTGFIGCMYALHNQRMPFLLPIDKKLVEKAVRIDTQLSGSLYKVLQVDIEKLKKIIQQEISRGAASGMMYAEMSRNIARASRVPLNRARVIVRTEAGRIQEQAAFDAAKAAKDKGADVVKQWSAIRDERTRYTHRLLDGQVRELDEYFEVHGKKALRPHGFGLPEEDINCRCTMLIRARAALNEDEYKRLQEIARDHGLMVPDKKKTFGHEKAVNFSDFKKNYLNAVK